MYLYRITIVSRVIFSIAFALIPITVFRVITANDLSTQSFTLRPDTPRYLLLQQADYPSIVGTYYGTVAIDKPLALGVLDISLTFTNNGDHLQGTLNGTESLAFSGSPAFTGQITGQIDGITTTFQIDTVPFTDTVSGRTVQRQVTLAGTLLDAGSVIQGVYTETIQGFTPQPLLVGGTFLASRASASAGGDDASAGDTGN